MIRVAVIGAGHWGPNLIRNFHTGLTSEVKVVVDSRSARLDQLSPRYPNVRFSTSVDDALGSDIDAVVVATPTATHFDLCRRALTAGKHVLVEKPVTTTVADALELGQLAEKHQRVLMVGHVFLFNPAVQRVKKFIADGELGRLHYLSMVRTNLGPIRGDVNAAWDLASHDISIADYWLGASAVSVSALGGVYINRGVEDVVFATLRYPNDVLVNVHCSWLNPRKNRDVTVVGDRRMLTFDDLNLGEPLRLYDKGVKDEAGVVDTFASFRASVRDGDVVIPRVAMGEPLKAECDHFLECIVKGAKPVTGLAVGASVVKTLVAMKKSLESRGLEVAT